MSVNQVNVAPQQQVQGGGFSLAPAIGLGAVGGTVGYFAGGKRPNLEKVFAMPADSFETITKDLTGEAKEAADTIGKELKEVEKLGKVDKGVQKTYHSTVNKTTLAADAPELKTLNEAKTALKNKINELKNAGKSNKEIGEALKGSSEVKNQIAAQKAYRTAQDKVLRESSDDALKGIVKNYDDAVKAAKDAKANKIADLAKNENITKAFDKIKKIFPKEGKWKAAGIWGSIAAGAGLLLGLFMAGSKKTQA